jgi:hypothetical protein
MRGLLSLVVLIGLVPMGQAAAGETVECASRHFEYNECGAGPLRSPQLIHQSSSSACIVNSRWGFNRRSGYIWVADGCAGVFADVGGYHHGRGDGYDANARRYDDHGHDVGAVAAGVVLAALLAGAADDNAHKSHKHHSSSDYDGCHGNGCLVDNPDAIDTRPQFDKDGNPNFDTHGNYQGCHGEGCKVDNPDANN